MARSLKTAGQGLELGKRGEDAACLFLKEQGYVIVARNYRCRCGEIDIIGSEKETLAFIEVKTRQSSRFGSPFEAVDQRKRHQIARTALEYLSSHRISQQAVRFDVVGVCLEQNGLTHCQLIRNAFEASW